MEDEFLYEARPAVRPEFAEGLASKLAARVDATAQPDRARGVGHIALGRPGLAIVALAIVAGCSAKVATLAWERRGDFWIVETEPICQHYFWETEPSTLSRAPEPVSVRDALAMLELPVKLPTWIPEGFKMREQIPPPAYPFENSWVFYPRTTGESSRVIDMIVLWIEPDGQYDPEVVAPAEAMEFIDIRGEQGLLVRGGCKVLVDPAERAGMEPGRRYEGEWVDTRATLRWAEDGVRYTLEIWGPPATADDLVRMARSMAPLSNE